MNRRERIPSRRSTRGSWTVNITFLVLGVFTVFALVFLDGGDVHLFRTRAPAPTAVSRAMEHVSRAAAASAAAAAEALRKQKREVTFLSALGGTLRDLRTMFVDPRGASAHFSYEPPMDRLVGNRGGFIASTFSRAAYGVLITLGLGFLTTLFGGVVALILGLLASRNLANPRLSSVIRGFVAFIRAVPTVLWVLIFAIGAGLGSVAAVVGMSFHSAGYLIKAYSESFEEIDSGVIEALKASGANWLQIVFQAVLPSSMGYIVSWTFVRFEINFTTAVAMGAAAGAGGIGYNLFMAGYYLNIHEIGYITYMILAVAIIMEVIATRLKKRYRLHE